MAKLESVMQKVWDFREIAKEVVSNACYGALLAKGFIVDETQIEPGILVKILKVVALKALVGR